MAKTPLAKTTAPLPFKPIPTGRTPVRAPGPKILTSEAPPPAPTPVVIAPPPALKPKHSSWPMNHRGQAQITPQEADSTSVPAGDSEGKAIPVTVTTAEDKHLINQFLRDMSLQKIALVPVNTNDYIGMGVVTIDLSVIQKLTRVPLAVTSQGGNLVAHPVLRKRHFSPRANR